MATASRATERQERHALPHNLAPRGLSRTEAAAYIGVGARLFDAMVADGRMPPPKRINARTVWDRVRLDAAFEALDEAPEAPLADDKWSRVAV